MLLRKVMLAATVMALPVVASAQPVNGLYIGGGGGVNIMHDLAVKSSPGTKVEMKIGAVGVASLGMGFGNGLRGEVEFDYRYNGLDRTTGPGGGSVSGSEQKYGPMINLLYDFYGVSPMFVPYIGAGAGYQWAALHTSSGGGSSTNTKGAFAYQAILGGAFPISSVPGLAVTAEYRFMGLAGDRKYGSGSSSVTLNDDYNHSVLIGLRYAFGAPATVMATSAAAVPAAAVQAARSYLVFFDWDKSNLTDRARQIIQEAAVNSTKVAYTKIEVNGYTDTSGTPQYNQALSIRRAQAVQAELIKDGVPRAAIAIQGYGETHPLVPTGDNVREPQNRRVEIIIR